MSHADDGQLHAYLDGEIALLGVAEAQAIEQHLAACAECRARLEEERRLRERAGLILRGSEAAQLRVPPFETLASRAAGGSAQRPASPRRRPATLLAWAASILLALGLGWYGRELMLTPRDLAMESAEPEAVAAAEPAEAAPPPAAPAAQAAPEPTPTVAAADVPAPRAPASPAPAGDVAAPAAPLSTPARAAAPPPPAEVAAALAEGRVTTAAGTPVAGAQVVIQGTSIGTLTRPDGSYSLVVPPARLPAAGELEIAVQSVGYASEARTVALKPGATVAQNFELQPAAVAREEVVVTGTTPQLARRQGVAAPTEAAPPAAEIRWEPVSRAEAARRLGGPLRLVPGLRVVAITAGVEEGASVIRAIQVLPEGGWLELLQRREGREVEAAYAGRAARTRARTEAAAAAPAPAAVDHAAAEDDAAATVVIHRDGIRITARAPVSPDSLRALLSRLR